MHPACLLSVGDLWTGGIPFQRINQEALSNVYIMCPMYLLSGGDCWTGGILLQRINQEVDQCPGPIRLQGLLPDLLQI